MKETITPAIKICDVRKRYGQHEVLQGIDMDVMPKEVVCLIGPSGSGKSTLLRCVNFLEVYDEGEILVEGALMGYEVQYNGTRRRASETRIRESRRDLGMVFQHFNLWPHMTKTLPRRSFPLRAKAAPQPKKKGWNALSALALQKRARATPPNFPAGSSSVLPLRAPWQRNRASCCLTSLPLRLTPNLWAMCCKSCAVWPTMA